MRRKQQPRLPLEAVKSLLEQGLYLRDVSRASGYTKPELSVMLKMWGLKRKRGPKPQAEGGRFSISEVK